MTTTVLDAVSGTRDFTKFDAYLDTQGLVFPLAEGMTPETRTKELRPVRQDTGANPWETRPETGDIFSQGEFNYGMNQTYFHRRHQDEFAAARRYLWSRGIDSSKGSVKLSKDIASVSAAEGPTRFAIAGATLFGIQGGATTGVVHKTLDLSTFNTENLVSASAIVWDLTSTGSKVYAAVSVTGQGYVYERDSAGTWTTFYGADAAGAIVLCHYTNGRLLHVRETGKVFEQTVSGTVNAAEIDQLPAGLTYTRIFTAGPFIYIICRNATSQTFIYHYGTNDAGTAIERKGVSEFANGFAIYDGIGLAGSVFLVGSYQEAAGVTASLFISGVQTDSGHIKYEVVAKGKSGENGGTELHADGISADAENIYFQWNTGTADELTGRSQQTAVYNFARGSFSLLPSTSSAVPATDHDGGTAVFAGRLVRGIDGTNIYATSETVYTASGTLITSIADWNNAGPKAWVDVGMTYKPMPAGGSIQCYYTTDHPEQNNWTLAGTANTLNATASTFTLTDVESPIFALKFVLNRPTDTTDTPELLSFSAKSYPKPSTTEWKLTRYVRIMDLDAKDGGGEEIRQNPEEVREWLLNKAHDTVTWYEAGSTWAVRVVDIGDLEPGQSTYSQTSGDPLRDVFYMRIVLEGTRTA